MYYLHGQRTDGTAYTAEFSSNTNFNFRLQEIQADPDRSLPRAISGTRRAEELPAYIRSYLEENNATYQQIGQGEEGGGQKRSYKLEIRTDDRMPPEMGGMLSQFKSWTILNINANYGPVEQLASALHEFVHLWRDDLERSGQTAAEIEAEAESDLIEACKWILAEHERKMREGV